GSPPRRGSSRRAGVPRSVPGGVVARVPGGARQSAADGDHGDDHHEDCGCSRCQAPLFSVDGFAVEAFSSATESVIADSISSMVCLGHLMIEMMIAATASRPIMPQP